MSRKVKILFSLSIVALLLDQVSKLWARTLEVRPAITVIEGWMNLIYVENRGAAWGLFSDWPEAVRLPFFIGISLTAFGLILFFVRRLKSEDTLPLIGLAMVLGGAIGNFIDRIAFMHVVDFIDVYYETRHWPTFNVADIFISLGVGCLLLEIFFGKSELSAAGAGRSRTENPPAPALARELDE